MTYHILLNRFALLGKEQDFILFHLIQHCFPDLSHMRITPTQGEPKVQERFVKPIKAIFEENPSFECRIVAHLLDMNKNTVELVFQVMGWLVRKRPVGFRPRIQELLSIHSPKRALGYRYVPGLV